MARKGNRKELYFSNEEKQLIRFAMKQTSLDETATIKLLVREALIQRLLIWRQSRIPRMPVDLEKLINEF